MTGPSFYGGAAAGWWPFHLVWTWWSWNLPADLHEMLLYPFIRQAFEAGTIIAVLAGVVSYLVVLRRSSFAAHALGHVGFSGAAAAVLFAVAPFWGLLLFTTVSGGGIALLGKRAAHRDVEIGTVLAFMLALGLMFLSFYQGFATQVYSILFGDIVAINQAQVWLTLYAAVAVLGVLAFVYRQLLFASLDEEVAEAKGMHTMLLGLVFMLALAVVISIAVTVIGVLLIFALAVTPAATAVRLVRRPLHAILVAVGIALFATWAGIFIAFWEVEPTSFFIVVIVFGIYAISRALPVNSGAVAPSPLATSPPARAIPMHPQGAAPFSLPVEAPASSGSETEPA
jgi:zinc/manganese transport system permease protein